MKSGTFEVYKDKRGQHRWRLKGANGEIMCSGQAHTRKSDAIRASDDVRRVAPTATLVEVDE